MLINERGIKEFFNIIIEEHIIINVFFMKETHYF